MQSDGGAPSEVSSAEWKLVAFVVGSRALLGAEAAALTRPDDALDCSLLRPAPAGFWGFVAGLVSVLGGQRYR